MSILMKEAIYKEIIKNKFIGAVARAINLVPNCLYCYKFNYYDLCGTPNYIKFEDIIEIFSNYSSLPFDDLKEIIYGENCSCEEEGF